MTVEQAIATLDELDREVEQVRARARQASWAAAAAKAEYDRQRFANVEIPKNLRMMALPIYVIAWT